MTAIGLAILGLFMGSFAGASVWRLRALQLHEDHEAGEEVPADDRQEVGKLKLTKLSKDRSVCLHCGHQLQAKDLIPLVSWVMLRGRCRYCKQPIGWFEPAIELAMAAFFVVSYVFWPTPLDTPLLVLQFACWLIAGVGLGTLFVYDAKWYLLPNKAMFPVMAIAAVYAATTIVDSNYSWAQILNVLASVATLGGLYYVIYVASHHKWVGYGDVKLGVVLGLLLADWRLGVLALFLANLIGTLLLLPLMMSGRLKRGSHVPFGPFMIAGWLLAGLFGHSIIAWYMLFTLGAL